MTHSAPFQAVIADMDGVLTSTAKLHEQAWKRMFDDFLSRHDDQKPFSHADYRSFFDGRPRYKAVADYLAARGIELPYGDPSDPPDRETVCGLGNRKNELFGELLEGERVDVYEGTLTALRRWRRGGLKLGSVSSSRNARRVLEAADLARRFDVIVDGQFVERLGLEGKPGLLEETARQLGVEPSATVVLEDATSGLRAARRCGFGLAVGVARNGDEDNLREAGAEQVVRDVSCVRFLRCVPHALDRLEELDAWRGGATPALFLDYDGTLAPICDDPRGAQMSDELRDVLQALAARCPVSIVSGRDREDVQARVGVSELSIAGNHGLDILHRGCHRTLPEAEEAAHEVDIAERELRRSLEGVRGVRVERKRFSVAVHLRSVEDPADERRVHELVDELRDSTTLRQRRGKRVVELEPAVAWDKGKAVEWLIEALPDVNPSRSFVLYIGDDETDEDAFRAIGDDGAGVRVGSELTTSLADYQVNGPEQVQQLLQHLLETSSRLQASGSS